MKAPRIAPQQSKKTSWWLVVTVLSGTALWAWAIMRLI
jgi:hypothetical protein